MQTARRSRTSAPPSAQTLAPGARISARGELWIVRNARPTRTGALEVHVTGLSELVRGRRAIFLSDLDSLQVLDPAVTELVVDDSPGYRKSRLYLESLLRQTPPTDERVYIGHRAAMDSAQYQLVPAAKALAQPRPRLLIADGVGLGKTLEVGILLSELIRRGRGRRILVVTLKSMLEQFQQELWARFTIPLVRLDTDGLAKVQCRIPANNNPFYYYDRVIISIDTLKRDNGFLHHLEQCHWDVIVVDECQHVAQRTQAGRSDKSQRAKLAETLAGTCDALIMASATPHDGRPRSFASLLNLLEPTAVPNEDSFSADDVKEYYVRRFKKDVAHDAPGSFSERDPKKHEVPASAAENALFAALADAEFQTIDVKRTSKGPLFRTLLMKSLLSSPEAFLETVRSRARTIQRQLEEPPKRPKKPGGSDRPKPLPTTGAAQADLKLLRELEALGQKAEAEGTTKRKKLVELLRKMGIGPKSSARVVVFSERIATLNMLRTVLQAELKLPEKAVEIFHGEVPDVDQQKRIKEFGTENGAIRVLLASDAASEGVNLHFFCHQLVQYDIPWSIITLEQRNGRIDRFGQSKRPELHYLLTKPDHPKLKGDLRILDALIEREGHVSEQLGDAAWLMNLGDAEQEEERIATAVSYGEDPSSVLASLDELDVSELLAAVSGLEGTPANDTGVQTATAPSLYANDLEYWKDALRELKAAKVVEDPEWHDDVQGLVLKAPLDLQQRFTYLPSELKQDDAWRLKLTADRSLVQRSLEEARKDTSRWPEWQLLWPLHPVAEWLDDRVLSSFARHEAPVLRVSQGLASDEVAFVMQGILSNQESQPVVVDWFAVRSLRGKHSVQDIAAFAAEVGLDKKLTNDGVSVSLAPLQALRASAVEAAKTHMLARRAARAEQLKEQLKRSTRGLESWKQKRIAALSERRRELTRDGRKLRADEEKSLQRDAERVERTVAHRAAWIKQRMSTSDQPFVRIAAVIVSRGDKR